MENKLNALHDILLMGPGPSCVPAPVYQALSCPTIGHLDPRFIEIMDEIKRLLQSLLNTQNALTLPVSGTGSAGMETCFVNLIEPGDPVLILSNGVFGKRMTDIATRLGANVDVLEYEWGKPVIVDDVKIKLESQSYKLVAVVHAETSTGVCNPVEEIGGLVGQSDALYLVDTVTSLGGMPVKMDEWNVDALYSGTQKCLSCPPGLSPVSFSDKAVEMLKQRKSKVPNWYLDLSMIVQYWEGAKRVYHHTAPINMLYGLYQALLCIFDEGFDHVFERHQKVHQQLVEGLDLIGLKMLVEPESRLPMLNAVVIPEGVDEANIRSELLMKYDIEIGPGLGPLAGKVWRIGLMGHSARTENVDRFLEAIKELMA